MQDIALGVGGILISLITFFVGYRQTLGARQARAHAADAVIIEVLLRRLVLEDLSLSFKEVRRVIRGKAADLRVSPSALRHGAQIADLLYSRVLESDLISAADRERSLAAIKVLQKEATVVPNDGVEGTGRPNRLVRVMVGTVLVVLPAGIGTVAVALASGDAGRRDPDLLMQFGITVAALVGVATIMAIRRGLPLPKNRLNEDAPTVRELESFPEEPEGVHALRDLKTLSCFAVRNLYQLGEDEHVSLRAGTYVGMSGDPSVSLGLQELLDRRLVEHIKARSPRARRNGPVYGLTPSGRSLARLLVAGVMRPPPQEDPPAYLSAFVGSRKGEQDAVGVKGGAVPEKAASQPGAELPRLDEADVSKSKGSRTQPGHVTSVEDGAPAKPTP